MDSCTLGQSVVHFLTVEYSVVVGGGGGGGRGASEQGKTSIIF